MMDDFNQLMAFANAPLKAGERQYLQALVDDEKLELEFALGGGWWLGDRQVSGRVAWSLIRRSCISRCDWGVSGPGSIERWRPNGIGIALLEGYKAESALVPETIPSLPEPS